MHHDLLQYLAECRRRRCLDDFSYMLMVWIRGKISRRDISRIVVPKNQVFTTHVVIGILETLNTNTDIDEFPHVQFRSIVKEQHTSDKSLWSLIVGHSAWS